MTKSVPPPARALRKLVQKLGMHPDDPDATTFYLDGRRALVVATNAGVLDVGKPTGVFASEMTVPYYAFLDAGMEVDVASPLGGVIPVDPKSIRPIIRTREDDRFLADNEFRSKVTDSLPISELDMSDYDIVFLAGGWGAAFDFGFSKPLATISPPTCLSRCASWALSMRRWHAKPVAIGRSCCCRVATVRHCTNCLPGCVRSLSSTRVPGRSAGPSTSTLSSCSDSLYAFYI